MRSDRACLLDILDAIAGIEKYLTTRESFDTDERTQIWMVSRLQTVGEAARHLSREFKERHPQIPWRRIIGMRHRLVHAYFDVEPSVVWETVTERVPELKLQISNALATDNSVQSDE